MSFTKEESEEHKKLVRSLIQYLKNQGWTITSAAVDGYASPAQVGTHIPDVWARKESEDLTAFGEAETCETLLTTQTHEQIDEFSNRVMKSSNKPVPFFIVVPASCQL